MTTLYLSRRNLETLLSKLDRQKNGEQTFCTIKKPKDTDGKYPNTAAFTVVAVENDEYYSHRPAGEVHPADEVNASVPASGTTYAFGEL